MQSRRTKWTFIALALITNLGGGPMAWAHLASGHCHEAAAHVVPAAPAATVPVSTDMPADCPGHSAAATKQSLPANPLPCCDGGGCACAAPPAPLSMPLLAPTDLRHDTLRVLPAGQRFSLAPLDDTLRPPIR